MLPIQRQSRSQPPTQISCTFMKSGRAKIFAAELYELKRRGKRHFYKRSDCREMVDMRHGATQLLCYERNGRENFLQYLMERAGGRSNK